MKIHFLESEYPIDSSFREGYAHEVKSAHAEAAALLPFGSKHVNYIVQPRVYNLIQDAGSNARTYNSELIELAFDPRFKQTTQEKILGDVKHSVYHELNHAARWNLGIWHQTFIDNSVLEGLATVFARDHAGEQAPWAQYPAEVSDWVDEIIEKNDMFAWTNYSFDHPDGRKWIAYKVGTYIVDEATKRSDKSVAELTRLECETILDLANITLPKQYTGLQ